DLQHVLGLEQRVAVLVDRAHYDELGASVTQVGPLGAVAGLHYQGCLVGVQLGTGEPAHPHRANQPPGRVADLHILRGQGGQCLHDLTAGEERHAAPHSGISTSSAGSAVIANWISTFTASSSSNGLDTAATCTGKTSIFRPGTSPASMRRMYPVVSRGRRV